MLPYMTYVIVRIIGNFMKIGQVFHNLKWWEYGQTDRVVHLISQLVPAANSL